MDWTRVDPTSVTNLRMAIAAGDVTEAAVMAALAGTEHDQPLQEERCEAVDIMERMHSAAERALTDDDGMGGTGEDSEWVLESILRRRRCAVQAPAGFGDVVAAVDVDDTETCLEYLCRWKGYEAPTWERASFLRDYGFGRQVATFDDLRSARAVAAKKVAHSPAAAASGPQAAPSSEQVAPPIAAASSSPTHSHTPRSLHPVDPKQLRLLELVAPLADELIAVLKAKDYTVVMDVVLQMHRHAVQRSADLGLLPQSYTTNVDEFTAAYRWLLATVLSPLRNEFQVTITAVQPQLLSNVAYWFEDPAVSSYVVYHGTAREAVQSIRDVGLLVPGKENGIRVRHGSAYGLGVYSALCLSTPLQYASQGDVFVCAAVQPDAAWEKATVRKPGNGFVIFQDVSLVAPVLQLNCLSQGPHSVTITKT